MEAEKSSSKGQAWLFCTTGLPSDIIVEVDDMTFHLHKFPLVSKSKKLHDLISEQEDTANSSAFLARRQAAAAAATVESEKGKQKQEEYDGEGGGETNAESEIEVSSCYITLREFPGGSEAFEMAAKFCYGVKIHLSAANAAALRCAGEVLDMSEEYSEENLISRTERFLSQSVFRSLKDSISALKSCENLMPMAEDLGIVPRCIEAISDKAAVVDPSLFGWPVIESKAPPRSNAGGADPLFEDLSVLCYDLFSRLLEAMKARDVSPDVIENCLLHFAKRCFPGISRSSRKLANSSVSESDQRDLLESIVANLSTEKCSSSPRATRILFGLLRTAIILNASDESKCSLERKIGAQLEQATLDDLLIPSYSYLNETLYDVDCVERILGYFLDSFGGERSPSIMLVGKLIDGYLSEIASDASLKPDKFCSLALSLPDQARLFDDGLYRAVDVYLKAHPWVSDSERERICRVMDCQKLTLEGCTHAAQNERLPLRAVVQVLFFEQLQLRHAIAGTLLAARGDVDQHNEEDEDDEGGGGVTPAVAEEGSGRWRATVRENQVLRLDMDSMKNRVHELERTCSAMKKVIEKIDTNKSWVRKKFGCKLKTQVRDSPRPAVVQGNRGRNVASNARTQS